MHACIPFHAPCLLDMAGSLGSRSRPTDYTPATAPARTAQNAAMPARAGRARVRQPHPREKTFQGAHSAPPASALQHPLVSWPSLDSGSRCPWEHKNRPKFVTGNPKIQVTRKLQGASKLAFKSSIFLGGGGGSVLEAKGVNDIPPIFQDSAGMGKNTETARVRACGFIRN